MSRGNSLLESTGRVQAQPTPYDTTSFLANKADEDAMCSAIALLREGARTGKRVLKDQGWSQAAAVQGRASEVADFKSEQFGSLVVHARDARVALSQTLSNLDHNVHLKHTHWVTANDGLWSRRA